MFHGRFHNNATQREINENNHFKEHGIGYYGRCNHENTPEIPKQTLGGILVSSPWPLLALPLAFAVFWLSRYPLRQGKGTGTVLMCVQINERSTRIPILRNKENIILAVIIKRNTIRTKSDAPGLFA